MGKSKNTDSRGKYKDYRKEHKNKNRHKHKHQELDDSSKIDYSKYVNPED